MSQRILCYLPAERVSLCTTVFSAQAIPVVDLCYSDRSRVPNGAWVRTRSKRDIPGKGPVILAGGQHRSPIRGRETWLEVTKPRKVPRGFAGIILRTRETGGWCAAKTWSELQDKLPKLDANKTILDVGFSPEEWDTIQEQFAGTVISSQLFGFSEFGLPTELLSLLQHLNETHLTHHNNNSVASHPLSEGLERLIGGTDWWRVSDGWLREDNPSINPPPWGSAALKAIDYTRLFGSVERFLTAYHNQSAETAFIPSDTVTSGPTQSIQPESVSTEKSITTFSAEDISMPRTIVTPPERSKEPIAIVGMGCRLPKASSIAELDALLRSGSDAIREVPTDRWDPQLFWDADPKIEDKTYSKIGGFIEAFQFEPKRFRIPPKVASQIDLVQQLTLMSVADALEDAKFIANNSLSNERVGVILGNSMGGESSDDHTVRTRIPEIVQHMTTGRTFASLSPEEQSALLEDIERSKETLPTINEDTMPGELANVIAGRIANAFDFNGPNYTVDAACASSMAAIQAAVKGLHDGDFDMAVTGGADRSMGVPTYVKFSKIGALSADISAPFDERANGFVMGEGCAILILKRLSDAERDGDRIYATIRGIGSSSDGKGKGITAPNPKGQRLALKRAYQNAGVSIDSVAYFECHGTSTQVGDKVEATVLAESLTSPSTIPRLGSIKSNIGHLKSAAGAAAVVKGALSLYHKTLYATANVIKPRQDIPLDKIQIQTKTEPWHSQHIRRAGVSAFGFGGTNFHLVLEEQHTTIVRSEATISEAFPSEITCLSGLTKTTLQANVEHFQLSGEPYFNPTDPIRVILSSVDDKERTSQIERLLETLQKERNPATLTGRGIFYTDRRDVDFSRSAKAFLFTGQGSQYLNMGMELANRFDIVQQTFDEAELIFQKEVGVSLKSFIEGNSSMSLEEREAQLKDTRIAQPATLAMDIAIARLLRSFGVEADMVAGHSLGEYAACVVAGIMSFTDAIQAVSARGREMAAIHLEDPGKMASISAGMKTVSPLLEQVEAYVIAANKNCPSQTVIAGSSKGVEEMVALCKEKGVRCQELQVSHAFHSTIVAPAADPLKRVLESLELNTPHLPISTNVTGDWFPKSVPHIIDVLSQQIASPVEWIKQIEGLYANNARIFIECGPKRALTGLTSTTLKGKEHVALHTNHPRRGEALSFIDALAQLTALGVIAPPSSKPTASAREQALQQEITDLRTLLQQQSSDHRTESKSNTSTVEVVCTGASLGLPGGERVFSPDNAKRILHGENRLTQISKKQKNLFLMKDIVRLQKNPETGQGEFTRVSSDADCIQWAGQAQSFDFVAEYNADQKWSDTLDITSKLAIAAGLEALKDAGIPLVEETRSTRSGLEQHIGLRLPKPLQADTGIVFASAFAGHTNFADHIARDGDDGTGQFDRRFLFQILAMGHSQFAQLIGAKGPNTHVNAACASTSQAIAIAEDWIRCGRARRVIVVGADDVTNETMLEWIGSGFLAVGAASTAANLHDAARPFDKSRNGMLLGMGAVGMMLERADDAAERGAEILATLKVSRVSNSAYHGTRLDIDHIATEMQSLVDELSNSTGLSPSQIAKETVFVSHETFTPARGGSAEAEIQGLKSAFGADTPSVLITNTKGFTGHAMGAGIEDVIAIKALQYQQVPPIPNLETPDDSANNLRFSRGGSFEGRFAIRLAAGFGSQLVLLAWQKGSTTRDNDKHQAWLSGIIDSTQTASLLEVTAHSNKDSSISVEHSSEPPPSRTNSKSDFSNSDVAEQVLSVIAMQTGYEISDLDLEYELEADLGIDTVKQAELFAELRETFGVPDDIQIEMTTAPTIQTLIDWFTTHGTSAVGASESPVEPSLGESSSSYAEVVLSTLAAQTGYEISDLDLEYELEADLGIDTVKQAELFAELRETFGVPDDIQIEMTTAPTIQTLIDWFTMHGGEANASAALVHESVQSIPSAPNASVNIFSDSSDEQYENFTPYILRTHWESHPVTQERPIENKSFRFVGNTPNDRQLIRALESKGLQPQADGKIVIERGRNIEEIFEAAKSLDAEHISHWLCILEVTSPNDQPAHVALKGGRSGLAKALAQEWPECKSKVIWIQPRITSKDLASIVHQELRSIDAVTEVYYENQDRFALTLQKESTILSPHSAPKTMVFSGGARGVTAEVAKGFIRYGCDSVFLLGRTPPANELVDLNQERQRIKTDLQQTGVKVTPVMIEERLDQIRRQQTVLQNINQMQSLGAEVTFIQTDIANRTSVTDAFNQIMDTGLNIDAVVHGAGVEESKPLHQKDLAAFRRVYHSKVQGALNILDSIPSSTFFLSMGSIAGRFGNQGQGDYSAANDAVGYICQQRSNSLHICWSAWAEVGMASRGGMDHLLTQRGIQLLPLKFAVDQAIAMTELRLLGEVIVTGALGPLPVPTSQPLLNGATLGPKGVHGKTQLGPKTSKWLKDHSIGGLPIFPGVIGLELMAQTVAVIHANKVVGIDNVQFERPIKFHRDQEVKLEVETEILNEKKVNCQLYSVRELAGNRQQRTLHFCATMHFVNPIKHTLLREEPQVPCSVVAAEIYKKFFHGPSFQVLEEVQSMSQQESLATGLMDHMSILPTNLLAPLAIENAFQAAGWHHWTHTQEMVLPKGIGSMQIFHMPTDWEGLLVRSQPIQDQPRGYNIDVYQNGSIVMTLREVTFVEAPNIDGNKDFWTPTPDVVIARSQQNLQIVPPTDTTQLLKRGNAKRRTDRIAGRSAMYRLLRHEELNLTVEQEPSGRPFLKDSEMGISISHCNEIGWAALNRVGLIGLDVEHISSRSPAFLKHWFTESEQNLTGDSPLAQTVVWTCKEAVSKLLGSGFSIHPQSFEVTSIDTLQSSALVTLHGEALALGTTTGGTSTLVCHWMKIGSEIMTFVTLTSLKGQVAC